MWQVEEQGEGVRRQVEEGQPPQDDAGSQEGGSQEGGWSHGGGPARTTSLPTNSSLKRLKNVELARNVSLSQDRTEWQHRLSRTCRPPCGPHPVFRV